jgi:hypothetical protein
MGRSWLALLLALAFCFLFRLYVTSEEAFLERCFGHDYREYRGWSHRYFGPPGRRGRPEPTAPAGGESEDRTSGACESEERTSGAWKKRVRQGDIVP